MSPRKSAAILLGTFAVIGACDRPPTQDPTAPEDPAVRPLDPGSNALAALSDTWATMPPLPSVRQNHDAVGLNNIVYVIGGLSPAGVSLTRVDAFNLATNTWSPRAPLPSPRSDLNGASAINGRIYVSGGHDASGAQTKTLFVYNPGTDTWVRKADMPRAGGCGTQGVIEGLLYVTTDCGLFSSDTTRFYRYAPVTNTWTKLASPPDNFNLFGVSGVIGGKYYLAGDGHLFVAYDPATKRWTERANTAHPERFMCAAVLNGKLFVAGGFDASNAEADLPGAVPTLRVYDPATNTWHFRASMPTPRWDAAGAAGGGRFFVISGRNETTVIMKVVAYTP